VGELAETKVSSVLKPSEINETGFTDYREVVAEPDRTYRRTLHCS
jgi:hypothetical protein